MALRLRGLQLYFLFLTDSWIMKGLISAQIVQDRNYAASKKAKDKGEQQGFLIHHYTVTSNSANSAKYIYCSVSINE